MPEFVTLKIELTATTITVSIINKDKKEIPIQLRENQTTYPLNIWFNKNEIVVCQQQQNENAISGFLEEIFNNPSEYKTYDIEYQGKKYEVLGETLLALIIQQFKDIIDKTYIVNRFLFKCSNMEKDVLQRIKSSLVNIGIPNSFTRVRHQHEERLERYIDEEFVVIEILEKQREYKRFVREINRAKELIKTTQNNALKKKAFVFEKFGDLNEWYTMEKYDKFKKCFTCRQRTELKFHHLDNPYCMMLAGKYFNSIDDYINVEFCSPQFVNNTDKYHFNPIPVDEKTANIFGNLETLYLYKKGDKYVTHPTVKRCINLFRRIGWYEKSKLQKLETERNIEYKNVLYMETDGGFDKKKSVNRESITIPFGVEKIASNAFKQFDSLKNITIPSTVTHIENGCFFVLFPFDNNTSSNS